MPSGMTVREFDRRADRLVAILPHAAALAAAGRLRDGSDHAGPEAHPYDASVLRVWMRGETDPLPYRFLLVRP